MNKIKTIGVHLRSFAVSTLLLCGTAIAQEKVPDIGMFNTACELYRTADFQGSEELFGKVATQTEDEKLKAKALYNQGTALLAGTTDGNITNRLEAVAEAIPLFEQSLELNPKNMDAKQNLERALNTMISGRLSQAEKLLSENEALLQQFEAKAVKENCESAKKMLAPVDEDFAPNSKATRPLLDRADGMLQMLDRTIEQTKEEMANAQHAIDMYEYKVAADVMLTDSNERKWAFNLDEELAQQFQQLIQNNQNIITIVYPQPQPTP
jgi:tetratricopeptide (TPR) repeat protein